MTLASNCTYNVSGVLVYVEQYTTEDGVVHVNPNLGQLEQYSVTGLGSGTVLD